MTKINAYKLGAVISVTLVFVLFSTTDRIVDEATLRSPKPFSLWRIMTNVTDVENASLRNESRSTLKPDTLWWLKPNVTEEKEASTNESRSTLKLDTLWWLTNIENQSRSSVKKWLQTPHVSEEEDASIKNKSSWKTIVYTSPWFESVESFGPLNMTTARCPYTRCNFTADPSAVSYADLVIYPHDRNPNPSDKRGHPAQLFGCTNAESPLTKPRGIATNCDWLISYTIASDLPASYYGHFLPINYTVRHLPGGKIDTSSVAYLRLQRALASNASLVSVIGEEKMKFLKNKTKIVAWMSGHCPTQSRREVLVEQLQQSSLPLDTYGKCGKRSCFKRSPINPDCWEKHLYKYSFFMSLENSLCPEYLTEKVYLPLLYGLVPVVYGGANYSQYLPPHSYIDAATLGVKALAELLQSLHNDTRQLERYHMWRGFYKVYTGGSLCEICAALHNPDKDTKQRIPPNKMWQEARAQCSAPPKSFSEPWVLEPIKRV